jgi:hypothetical protein
VFSRGLSAVVKGGIMRIFCYCTPPLMAAKA